MIAAARPARHRVVITKVRHSHGSWSTRVQVYQPDSREWRYAIIHHRPESAIQSALDWVRCASGCRDRYLPAELADRHQLASDIQRLRIAP